MVRTRARSAAAVASLTVLAAAALAGCSSQVSNDAADAASRFEKALSSKDMAAACALLAPGTVKELEDSSEQKCAKALADADLPDGGSMQRTEVAGHSAQAVLKGDTLFLALFDDGWRVLAAGCTHDGSDDRVPYDCAVKG